MTGDLTVNNGGAIMSATDITAATATINDTIGSGTVNSVAISGATNLGANVTPTTQSYGATVLTENVTLDGSAITFTNTVNADAVADGDETLTVTTGSAQFEGAVGGSNALGNIGVATMLTVTNTGSIANAGDLRQPMPRSRWCDFSRRHHINWGSNG